ncbi:MAG: deoxyribonuclease V [Nitrospinota bacterium]|nr:deoxyribonuclease V [Nitrospinota bacterium]
MKALNLHSWKVTPQQALKIQTELANQVEQKSRLKPPQWIAGADISLTQESNEAFAGIVVLNAKTLKIADEYYIRGTIDFPYIPGLLSFREAPLLLKLFKKVSPAPQLIFFDGHGIAHPRKLGLASHLGLFLDCPTIGCAKSRLTGKFREPGLKKGSRSRLLDKEGQTIGSVLRTRENCKPVFVSVGHQIDLDSAVQWSLKCTTHYRIPEPTRLAHIRVNAFRKNLS